jgi:hypothetical protein
MKILYTDPKLWVMVAGMAIAVFKWDVNPELAGQVVAALAGVFILSSGLSDGMRRLGRAIILAADLWGVDPEEKTMGGSRSVDTSVKDALRLYDQN